MKNRIRETWLPVGAMALLILSGCGGHTNETAGGNTAAPKGAAHQQTTRPVRLRQFQPGDSWTFRERQKSFIQKTVISVLRRQVTAPDGKPCSVFEIVTATPAGKAQRSYAAFRQDKDGSELLYGVSKTDLAGFVWGVPPNDHSVRIESPLSPRLHWKDTMKLRDGRIWDFEALALNEEKVVVPAGQFRAFQVQEVAITLQPARKGEKAPPPDRRENTAWVAPEVGFPIKQASADGATVQELVSYHLAPSPKTSNPSAELSFTDSSPVSAISPANLRSGKPAGRQPR